MHAGYKDVFVSVIVVVADGHAGVVTSAGQASFFGNVGKRAIAVVTEEPVPIFWRSFFQTGDVCAIGEKNVRVAVIVVVEDRNASGHRFRCVLLRRLATIESKRDGPERKMDARFVQVGRGNVLPRASRQRQHQKQGQADHRGESSTADKSIREVLTAHYQAE